MPAAQPRLDESAKERVRWRVVSVLVLALISPDSDDVRGATIA
jgi:hypothetical protein